MVPVELMKEGDTQPPPAKQANKEEKVKAVKTA